MYDQVLMVTGSRDWDDRTVMYEPFHELSMQALIMYGGMHEFPITVIHGDQEGADKMAGEMAKSYAFDVKPFPADMSLSSPYRYHKRNDQMLATKPLLVWAFRKIGAANRGTDSVIRKAKKLGIRVITFEA